MKKGIPYLIMAFLITGFQLQIRLDMLPVFGVVVLGNMLLYWLIFFSIGLLHFILISAEARLSFSKQKMSARMVLENLLKQYDIKDFQLQDTSVEEIIKEIYRR